MTKFIVLMLIFFSAFGYSRVVTDNQLTNTPGFASDIDAKLGANNGQIIINKFARNNDIDTASDPEDIWNNGGTYTGFPASSDETVDLISTSGQDTADTGTGCWTMRVYGLDSNKDLQEEVVDLNGATGATTTNTFTRVYRAICETAGTGASNAGAITIRHTTTTANIFAKIPAGFGQTETANFTIPRGYTGYLVRYQAAMIDNNANNILIYLWKREEGKAVRLTRPFSITPDEYGVYTPYGGVRLVEKTDFMFRVATVTSDNADVTISWDLVLIPNQ